jgi:alanine racemase
MDQCVISLKNAPLTKTGDSVIIFGDTRRGAFCDAGAAAEIAGTIPYEILCGISKRVPRVYV